MKPSANVQGERPIQYELVVRGELSDRFAAAFPEMTLYPDAGQTRIRGAIVDQAHLHGILERLCDFGIELVSLNEVGEHPPPAGSS